MARTLEYVNQNQCRHKKYVDGTVYYCLNEKHTKKEPCVFIDAS